MSRILLADDSPHAQRMGERILREEGFEVVTVTDGETALIRLADVDPDVILADILLPQKSGYEICDFVKKTPRYQHARVVLLAGLLEPVDEAEAARVKADAVLKKPLEASAVIATVKPLAYAARQERTASPDSEPDIMPTRMTGSILGLSNLPPSRPPRPAAPPPQLPTRSVLRQPSVSMPPAPPQQQPAPKPEAAAPPVLRPEPAAIPVLRAEPAVTAPEPEPEPPVLRPEPASQQPWPEPAPELRIAPAAEPRPEPPALEEPVKIAEIQIQAAEKITLRPIEREMVDPELVRAAVTIALDRAMPALIDEISRRVAETLRR